MAHQDELLVREEEGHVTRRVGKDLRWRKDSKRGGRRLWRHKNYTFIKKIKFQDQRRITSSRETRLHPRLRQSNERGFIPSLPFLSFLPSRSRSISLASPRLTLPYTHTTPTLPFPHFFIILFHSSLSPSPLPSSSPFPHPLRSPCVCPYSGPIISSSLALALRSLPPQIVQQGNAPHTQIMSHPHVQQGHAHRPAPLPAPREPFTALAIPSVDFTSTGVRYGNAQSCAFSIHHCRLISYSHTGQPSITHSLETFIYPHQSRG